MILVYYQHEETGITFERIYEKEEDIEQFSRRVEYKREVIEDK